MITGRAKEELENILKFSSEKDLKIIELKLVPGNPQSYSRSESIEAILSCTSQPSDVLRQQRLRKSVIRRYLWQCGIPVTQEQSKSDYIRIFLDQWQIKDDDYLWRFRSYEEIDAEIDRFQEKFIKHIRELKCRIREKETSSTELCHMKKCMDKFLQTIDSIGNRTSSFSSAFQEAISSISPSDDDSDSSPSDEDSDSSSSASSVEIIEHHPEPEPASEQTLPRMNTHEPASNQVPPVESLSSQHQHSVDISDPSSSQQLTSSIKSEPPSSQEVPSEEAKRFSSQQPPSQDMYQNAMFQEFLKTFFASRASGSPASEPVNQNMSPSKRGGQPLISSLPSKRIPDASPSKLDAKKNLKQNTTVPSSPDKRFTQTDLSKFLRK